MLKKWGIMWGIMLLPLISYAEVKLGYVDSQRILEGYRGGGEITADLHAALQNWEREAMSMRGELERMLREFESQMVILSERARRERGAEIQAKQMEYQEFIQRIWGPGGEAETRQRELMRPFIEKVNKIITDIGEREGYTMIFDIAAMGVVYAPPAIDLTHRILDELNREHVEEDVVFPGVEETEFYVMRLKEKNKEAEDFGLGMNLKEKIRAAIMGIEGYREVRPTKMRHAFTLANITTTEDRLTDDEIKTIGRLAEADFMISGEVEKLKEVITVRTSLWDMEKETMIKEHEAKSDGEREKDILNLVSKIVGELLPYMVRGEGG